MRTYSHWLIGVGACAWLERRGIVVPAAFLYGAVSPDLPLIGLGVGFAIGAWTADLATERWFAAFDHLYFHDPLWIVGHNLLHAPLVLGLLGLLGVALERSGRAWGATLRWFALGCLLHTAIDVVTHHRDGPLLWFPFDWTYRFPSAVSYWHPAHYGRQFTIVEHLLDFGGLVALALARLRRRTPELRRLALRSSS